MKIHLQYPVETGSKMLVMLQKAASPYDILVTTARNDSQ